MNEKISNKEIVFAKTFMIPLNETLDFSFSPTHPHVPESSVSYNKVSVHVHLRVTGGENDPVKAEWGRDNGHQFVTISVPAVKNRIGPAILNKPIKIGEFAGKSLGFYAAFFPSGSDMSLVMLQFMLGGDYE
jgi:hypothetical protein